MHTIHIQSDLFSDQDILVLFAAILRTAYKVGSGEDRKNIEHLTRAIARYFVDNNLWGREPEQELVHSFSTDDSDNKYLPELDSEGKMGRGYQKDWPWAFRVVGMHMAFDEVGLGELRIKNSPISWIEILSLFFEAVRTIPADATWLLSHMRIALEYRDENDNEVNDNERVVNFLSALAREIWEPNAMVLVQRNQEPALLAQIDASLNVVEPVRNNTMIAPMTAAEIDNSGIKFYHTQPIQQR